MPYVHVDDLPADVREQLPDQAQQIFLAAFNDAEQSGGDASDREGCCFKIAWDAVSKSYQQDAAGTWIESQNLASFGNIEAVPVGSHDAILQGLDQWLPSTHAWVKGGKTRFGVQNFKGTESKWDQVPLIFIPGKPVHPNNQALRENLDAEIARIGGRIAGSVSQTAIQTAGTPRLQAHLSLDDPEVQSLHADGHLGQSTGFDCLTFPSGHLAGTVEPSHILLFDLRNGAPNDPKTMFLNLSGETDMAENDPEMKGLLAKLTSALEGFGKGPAPVAHTNVAADESAAKLAEQAQMIELANVAKATAEAELEAAKAKLAEFANLETQRIAAEKEALWLEIKNTMTLGSTYKPEDEAAARARWEADPSRFALDLVHANLTRAPAKGAQGASFVNTAAAGASDEQALADLGYPSLEISGGN